MPHSSWRRPVGFWTGVVAITVALVLYVIGLLADSSFEPLLILGVLVLLPIGIYLTAEKGGQQSSDELNLIRLAGPGEPGSQKRQDWVFAQIHRARSIRKVVLSVLVAALSLFIANHVTGSIGCSVSFLSVQCGKGDLTWQTHAARLGEGPPSTTGQGATLSSVALKHHVSPGALAKSNPAARLAVSADLTSLLDASKILKPPTAGSFHTIESAASTVQLTTQEFGTGFPTATLVAGQSLAIPAEAPYDPRQWFDWLLWALVGLSCYLLLEVGRHLRAVPDGEGDFLGETTWYWAQLATGPFIAFIILLLLTHIDVNLLTGDEAAVQVNLHQYPIDLLIVPAFLLGFYSRVARELLDQLGRAIFSTAWKAAYGGFQVVIKGQAGDDTVASASTVVFDTQPPTAVVWSATAGTINTGGVFTPPPVVAAPQQVFITAVATGTTRAVTKAVTVVKHKFDVGDKDGLRFVLVPGKDKTLVVNPVPQPQTEEALIVWELVKTVPNGVSFKGSQIPDKASGKEAVLTVPSTLGPSDVIHVKVTYAGLSHEVELSTPRIEAKIDGQLLASGGTVATDKQIDLRVIAGLDPKELAKVEWSSNPQNALTFNPAVGEQVTAKVDAAAGTPFTVIAKHPTSGAEAQLPLTT